MCLNAYVTFLFSSRKDKTRALEVARGCTAVFPNDANVWVSLAKALLTETNDKVGDACALLLFFRSVQWGFPIGLLVGHFWEVFRFLGRGAMHCVQASVRLVSTIA